MSDTASTASPPGLDCLGGQSPPHDIIAGIDRLVALPIEAKQKFWDALGAVLSEPIPPDADAVLDAFARQHRVSKDDLAGALKAARHLVRAASARNLARAAFSKDLDALRPGDAEFAGILLRGFEAARDVVRRDIVARSVVAHGKLLVDVDWRVDVVAASNHGLALEATIGLLTLRYEENGRQEVITLQATPALLQKLAASCKQMLG